MCKSFGLRYIYIFFLCLRMEELPKVILHCHGSKTEITTLRHLHRILLIELVEGIIYFGIYIHPL